MVIRLKVDCRFWSKNPIRMEIFRCVFIRIRDYYLTFPVQAQNVCVLGVIMLAAKADSNIPVMVDSVFELSYEL